MTALTHDEVYQIMLNMDINDIKVLCLTNKSYHQICNQNDFWRALFKNHGLKIYQPQHTLVNWIKEYNKVLKASKEADDILRVVKQVKITKIWFEIPHGKKFTAKLNNTIKVDKQIVNDQEFRELLINLLYNHPDLLVVSVYRYVPISLRKFRLAQDIRMTNHYIKGVLEELYQYY